MNTLITNPNSRISSKTRRIQFNNREFFWDNRACLIRSYNESYIRSIINSNSHRNVRILDVGCGAGHMIISLSLDLGGYFLGVDISPEAIELANMNKSLHQSTASLLTSDLFSNVSESQFDIIIANLPYEIKNQTLAEKESACMEPDVAIYDESGSEHGILKRFLTESAYYLDTHGQVFLELPDYLASDASLPGVVLSTKDGEQFGRHLYKNELFDMLPLL